MKWIDVKESLPNHTDPVFGICYVQIEGRGWSGICSVFFNPRKGWFKCGIDDIPIMVIKWMEVPREMMLSYPKIWDEIHI